MNQLDFSGKRTLVRVDFNVPINSDGKITDNTRIVKAVPTIKAIIDGGGSAVLMSHLGRPQSKKNEDGSINKAKFSLSQIVKELSTLLGREVIFSSDCVGHEAIEKSNSLKPGEVLLLENTRFYKEETAGDEEFAARLSKHGELFINDAFGTAHRAHASTTTVARFFKSENKSAGLLLSTEIANAKKVLNSPKRPCTAILGGAKVSDKIKLIEKLIDFANYILVGGGMSYTFIKAMGGDIGNSLFEEDYVDLAAELMQKAKDQNVELLIPEDTVTASSFSNDAFEGIVDSIEIPDGQMGLDIGPKAIEHYSSILAKSQTIIWNGPVGVFEMENYSKGTFAIAQAVADATSKGAFSLIGGGDSVSAVNKSGLADKVSFISTGGGALLEFLEGKSLPGIAALK